MLTLVLLLVSIDFEVGLCLLWYCCWYQLTLRLAYVTLELLLVSIDLEVGLCNFGIVVGINRS